MRLAVLGLGHMGHAFAARALEKGHHVTVWNRSANRAGDLLTSGAIEAPSPDAAVADSEVVLVVVADDNAVDSVCLGEHGVMTSLLPGTTLAIVSTVAPDTVGRIAAVGPRDRVLDSPVMGSPASIAAGMGSFLIGGHLPTITSLEPLWTDLGAGYTYCGGVGSGATMKVVSNLLLITGVTAVAEAISTARAHGIPDDLLKGILFDSFVVSPASKVRLESLFDDAHPGWFTPALARKDVKLAVDLAEQAEVGVRIGPATETLLAEVIDTGRSWPDFSAVIEAFRQEAGP